jgi:hypothetical protein
MTLGGTESTGHSSTGDRQVEKQRVQGEVPVRFVQQLVAEQGATTTINVVVNWQAGLNK